MKTRLQINSVSFTLPTGQKILHAVNLQVNPGEFLILVGSNGSGKSSLIKLINRQYQLREGNIQLNNKTIQKYSNKKLAQSVITLTQFTKDSLFMDLTVSENAKLIGKFNCHTKLATYLNEFNPALAQALKRPVSELSGGEQQQLAFALYMTKRPDLLLLDEHTSALDPKTAEKIMQMTELYIRQHHLTCIMTTHNLTFAERHGDRLIAMKNGRLLQNANSTKEFLETCYA